MGTLAKMSPVRTLGLPILLLLISACGGGSDSSSQKGGESKDSTEQKLKADQEQKQTEDGDQKKSPVLPSTLQVASSFKSAGLPYKEGLTLSPDLVKEMVNPARKKLAFGAYSADLAYLVLNDKGDKGLKVMSSLMDLAKDLNLSSVFNTEQIAERFRNNINNRDTLVQLIVEVQQRFDTYVAKNRTRTLRTVSYAGGWSEAMYLAARSGAPKKKKKLHLEVEEQMTILDKLLKALDRDLKKAKGPIGDLLKELKAMDRIYKKKGPKPGQKLPEGLMENLKDRAIKARKIISKTSS